MSKDKDDKGYKVGYGCPPTNRQFGKKGGNPRNKNGRKKVNKTLEEEVKSILNEKISVKKDGQDQKMSKRQLLLDRIVTEAIKGNDKMMRLAIPLLKMADNAPEFEELPEDTKALKALLVKMGDSGEALK